MAKNKFRPVKLVYNPKKRKKQDNRKKVLRDHFKRLNEGQRRKNGKFAAQRR